MRANKKNKNGVVRLLHQNKMRSRSRVIFAVLAVAATAYIFSVVNVFVRVHQLEDSFRNNFMTPGDQIVMRGKSRSERKKIKHDGVGVEKESTMIILDRNEVNSASEAINKQTRHHREAFEAQMNETKKKLKGMESKLIEWRGKYKVIRPNFHANPYGHMVNPEMMFRENEGGEKISASIQKKIPDNQILTAYLELTNRSTWESKPLPVRNTKANDLIKTFFPKLNSCSRLPEQFPVDDYPDADPFLPWIHDVFPTEDGKWIQFVAQNKRRCRTGRTDDEEAALYLMAPQVALFQHVPLVKLANSTKETPRYRLCSHEEADPESISTRFICRFKPSGDITFSVFNVDYEHSALRKRQQVMFHEHGRDNGFIHTSQLIFKCPVPEHLVESVQNGSTVIDDWATIFVDLIPVRTPPRYGPPDEFLSPYYDKDMTKPKQFLFNPDHAWGDSHILPRIEDSGRWENIPVCLPSLMTYEPHALKPSTHNGKVKKHHLVSCLWASTGYTTRGNRYAINDGQRRLVEWISFNKILGFDHFYVYDNSAAFTNHSSLQPVANMFPEDVTLIKWPIKVCNNNPNNVDSIGERSSQYAAESSCRLRFGPHTNWIGQFDIDEYLIPMGNFSSLMPLLDRLDAEGNKIISFASWRAWPRKSHINDPGETTVVDNKEMCGRSKEECFELSVKKNTSIMEAYNCDRQKPGQKGTVMPAEKQIYKANYVKQHFIHYSTITETTELNDKEYSKKFGRKKAFPDPLSRFGNEINEGLMLHSKAIARQDTAGWKKNCHNSTKGFDQCRLGIPFPDNNSNATSDKNGWEYNCYVNPRIDNYWASLLNQRLQEIRIMN